MPKLRVISRAYEQPAVTERDEFGFPVSFHASKLVWAPALYKYCGGFVVREDRGNTDWTLCIVEEGVLISPAASLDADVKMLPVNLALDTVLTGARLSTARNWIAATDWTVTITDGMTVRQAAAAIQQALRNSGPDPDGLAAK